VLQNKNPRVYLVEDSINSSKRNQMEQETQSKRTLTNNIQLRISPKQKAFILMQSARKHQTPSTYLRNLINVTIKNSQND